MNKNSLTIINTGGTFNKVYNPKKGALEVPEHSDAVEGVTDQYHGNLPMQVHTIVHKDSLDLTDADRELIAETVADAPTRRVVIVHGTDTMTQSAAHLHKAIRQDNDKQIVFVGAMMPFSIDTTEAAANFSLAAGFLQAEPRPGIYIAMHGLVLPFDKIVKDRDGGRFVARN